MPVIEITAYRQQDWQARYRMSQPVGRLLFQRSPDESRTTSWKTEPDFEIVTSGDGEILRRRDGARFTAAVVRMAPVYRTLPKDYAPFSPFGDGAILFHTGRFFACPESCPDEPRWMFELTDREARPILVDGARKLRAAAWTDGNEGRSVYIGNGKPVDTPDLLAVIDGALPRQIRDRMMELLPRFMRHFSEKLGGLSERPMMFASYDTSHKDGWGRQGGVLPGQIFTHFYGSRWPDEMAKPDFASDLAWHFAHEAAHLYQRQLFAGDTQDSWIHEGGAEMFAALALRATDPASRAFVESKFESAHEGCAKALMKASLRDTLKGGASDAAYSCGLILGLTVDEMVRRDAPRSDGIYSVWSEMLKRSGAGTATEADFLAALAAVAGPALAEEIKKDVRASGVLKDGPLFELAPGRTRADQ